jgi:ferrous-iron efflux pump FieF
MKADNKLDKARSVSYTKLALSFLLTVFKLLAGFFGNSTLLLADAVRSFSEFVNESVKLLDLFIVNKPEDKSHNYGHGKIATLCLGGGACVLLFAGFHTFSLGSEQLLMFIQGKESEGPETIALFAAISAFVSRYIIFAESYELQTSKTSSKGRIHIKGLFASGFIILGIGITFLPGRSLGIADSLAAVLLSIYLLWTSGRLLYKAADELIEASLDEETNRKIREIINETEGVTGSMELKTRRIGKGIAINACITVPSSLSIRETSEITNLVEESLKAAFGESAYTLIKVEPSPLKNLSFQNRSRPS